MTDTGIDTTRVLTREIVQATFDMLRGGRNDDVINAVEGHILAALDRIEAQETEIGRLRGLIVEFANADEALRLHDEEDPGSGVYPDTPEGRERWLNDASAMSDKLDDARYALIDYAALAAVADTVADTQEEAGDA